MGWFDWLLLWFSCRWLCWVAGFQVLVWILLVVLRGWVLVVYYLFCVLVCIMCRFGCWVCCSFGDFVLGLICLVLIARWFYWL